jgi:hypothetical protein
MPVVPGVYVREEEPRGGGGISRATVDAIVRGYTLATSYSEGRDRPGHARAYGLAPDGVTAVTLRLGVHDRRSITVPVKNNVFQTTFAGHAGANIRLYFHTAKGVKAVGPRPPSRAARRRQHAARRRERARDIAATAIPQITPSVGRPHTVFTVRLKVAHPTSRGEYLVTLRGPKASGCESRDRIGVLPAQAGALRGLVKASLGFPRSLPGWCRGAWRGTVTARTGHRVVGRFAFRVR